LTGVGVTDVASEPADFSLILAERARLETAERERNLRRSLVAAIVLILHVAAISVFIYSSRIPLTERIRTTVPEAIFWFVLPPKPAQPKLIQPELPAEPLPLFSEPITLPPIPARPLPAEPPSGGLLGVGRSLACGASSYEYLSLAQREQCLRHPWHFVKRPDGTIVLDMSKPLEPPPSTINIIRHQQETAPPCPILANVPCLGKVMHGDPTGGGPSPF
jgi:hypothetical protein